MNTHQRRTCAIELTLTPREVVLVWLRSVQAGTLEEGARRWPPHRGEIANRVLRSVRGSMKGQADPLVERAILQARRQADLLYRLVVNANVGVLGGWEQHRREYVYLLGYLSAEMRGKATKNDVEQPLRLALLTFLGSVISLDAALAQLVAERLGGHPVLFRDAAAMLAEQLEMAKVTDGQQSPQKSWRI
jgi:hypothetical protein